MKIESKHNLMYKTAQNQSSSMYCILNQNLYVVLGFIRQYIY